MKALPAEACNHLIFLFLRMSSTLHSFHSYFFLTQLSPVALCWHTVSLKGSVNDLISLWPHRPRRWGHCLHTHTHTKLGRLWQLSEHLTSPLGLFNLWSPPLANVCCDKWRLPALWTVTCVHRVQMPRLELKIENKQMWITLASICLKIPKTKHFLEVCIWCVQPGVWFWASVAVNSHLVLVWVFVVSGCVECLVTRWHAVFGALVTWIMTIKSW